MSKRVLIVDDYPDTARILCDLLGWLGHTCRAAACGRDALAAAVEHQPEVIILDIGLPDISGYDLAPRLRSALSPRVVRIGALTGWGAPADRERSRAAGIDIHVVKPPTLAKLTLILDGAPDTTSSAPAPA